MAEEIQPDHELNHSDSLTEGRKKYEAFAEGVEDQIDPYATNGEDPQAQVVTFNKGVITINLTRSIENNKNSSCVI